MATKDFDIESLAAYLHLTPPQVARMADRGQLPGRRIGGNWRFSLADIHHWLEDRIGVSDDSELEQVESVLHRQMTAEASRELSLARLLPVDAIAIPLGAKTRGSVIDKMVAVAAATGLLWDPPKMAAAVRDRENLHPTALDNGVALLHPRRPMGSILAEPFLALGRVEGGIPFGGSRGVLTDLFFLICSTDDQSHLTVLARLSRLLSDPALLQGLRSADDAVAAQQWIASREAELFGD